MTEPRPARGSAAPVLYPLVAAVLSALLFAGCAPTLDQPVATQSIDCPPGRRSSLTIDGVPATVERAVAIERPQGALSIRLASFPVAPEVLADPTVGTTSSVDLAAGQTIVIVDIWESDGKVVAAGTYVSDPAADSQTAAGLLSADGARPLEEGTVTLTARLQQRVCGKANFGPVTADFTAPIERD